MIFINPLAGIEQGEVDEGARNDFNSLLKEFGGIGILPHEEF